MLVFTFAAAVLCEEHAYTIRTQHEPAKEYRKHYEQVPIRVQEEQDSSREVQYSAAPESHGHGGHAYSSQSIIHHAALAGQEESQESHNEHIAPVYQYVQEEEEPANNEAPAHRVTPAQHYQTIQYVPPQQQNEVQSHPVHAHAQSQFRHSHEGLNYQNGGNAHEGVSFHQGAQLHTSVHHRVPVHNVAQAPQAAPVRHAAPVHYVGPVHHEAPIHHEAPVHHAVPVEHAEVYGHDSHDEPIDYYVRIQLKNINHLFPTYNFMATFHSFIRITI